MTAYRVMVAERKDTATVTVRCAYCEAEVSVNCETAKMPEQCPCCNKAYDGEALTALAALARFHQAAKAVEGRTRKPIFFFHIRRGDAAPGPVAS